MNRDWKKKITKSKTKKKFRYKKKCLIKKIYITTKNCRKLYKIFPGYARISYIWLLGYAQINVINNTHIKYIYKILIKWSKLFYFLFFYYSMFGLRPKIKFQEQSFIDKIWKFIFIFGITLYSRTIDYRYRWIF